MADITSATQVSVVQRCNQSPAWQVLALLSRASSLVTDKKHPPLYGSAGAADNTRSALTHPCAAADQASEAKCTSLNVFMSCIGHTSEERQRAVFAPTATPKDAREVFGKERGKPVGQPLIQDEHGA